MFQKVFFLVLLWILWIPLTLVGVLPIIVLWSYYVVVRVILRRCLRPDLVAVMKIPDSALSCESFYETQKNGIALVQVLQGTLDLGAFKERLSDVLTGKWIHPGEGPPKYERLTSLRPAHWLGYSFWKVCDKVPFDLESHVKVIQSSENVDSSLKNWLVEPFARDRPLWDILVIRGYTEGGISKSLFGFRIHHALGDGYSLAHFVERLADLNPSWTPGACNSSPSRMTFVQWAIMWLSLPMIVVSYFLILLSSNGIFGRKKSSCEIALGKIGIDLFDLKKLRRLMSEAVGKSVPLATVLQFLLGSALQRASNEGYLEECSNLGTLKIGIALPIQKAHSRGTFCTQAGPSVNSIPMGTLNPLDRLREMMEEVSWHKATSSSELLARSGDWYSFIPIPLMKAAYHPLARIIIMGNLPLSSSATHFCGLRLLNAYFLVNVQFQNIGFTFYCLSAGDQMNISILSNAELMTEGTIAKVLEYLQDEVKSNLAHGFQPATATA